MPQDSPIELQSAELSTHGKCHYKSYLMLLLKCQSAHLDDEFVKVGAPLYHHFVLQRLAARRRAGGGRRDVLQVRTLCVCLLNNWMSVAPSAKYFCPAVAPRCFD